MSTPTIAIDARLVGTRSTGDATYWRGLLQGLAELEPEATFLLFSNTVAPAEVPDSPRFRWIHLRSRSSRWWSWIRFPLAARKAGAAAIHTQYTLSPLAGPRGITTIHDVSFLIEPSWFKPKDALLLRKFVRPSARRAARVLTVSETAKTDILRFYPEIAGKVSAIHLAPSPGIYPVERAIASERVRQELGIASPFLLTVGTRWPRKNMQLAIEAAELLPESLEHPLLVTGKPGWDQGELRSRTLATGYVTDAMLSALYSAADLYLAPSHYEGFGLTVLEAFRCGSPVLCSAGGAHPEVAGNAAVVMPDGSAAAWAEAIRGLLLDSSKLDALRALGLERAAAFSWRRTAEQTMRVYREVTG